MPVETQGAGKIPTCGAQPSQPQWFLMVVAVVFFLCAVSVKANAPLAEWDHVAFEAARSWASGMPHAWIYDHPPLYPAFLSFVFRFFPAQPATARLANATMVLLTAALLLLVGRKLFNAKTAVWAVILFLSCPVVIQGVQSMDMADTSLLPLLFSGTAWAIWRVAMRPTANNALVLAAVVLLCGWGKVSATIGLAGCLLASWVFLAVSGKDNPVGKAGWGLAAGFAIGAAAYLVSSYAILCGLWGWDAFAAPLQAAAAALRGQNGPMAFSAKLASVVYSTLRVIAWFSPFVLLAFLLSLWRLCKNGPGKKASANASTGLIGGTAAVFFLGHLVIGGTNWGFPRYHAPIAPLLLLFAGHYLSASKGGRVLTDKVMVAVILLTAVGLTATVAGDPLLCLNIEVKTAMVNGQGIVSIASVVLPTLMAFWGIPILVAMGATLTEAFRGRAFSGMCLVTGIWATVTVMNVTQAKASYRTSLQYGAAGKEEVVTTVRANIASKEFVLAAPEFIYALRDRNVPAIGWAALRSPDAFKKFVLEKKPAAIVAGLTVSDVAHLRWLLDDRMAVFLASSYDLTRIGTYFLWLRCPPESDGCRKS